LTQYLAIEEKFSVIQKLFRELMVVSVLALPIASVGVQSAMAEDLQFTLKNTSSRELVGFYVESTDQNNWGDNILQGSILPGEMATVTIADGKTTCMYGIKGVFEDGSVVEEEDLDLCQLGSYTYKD
jgi:hypothetical protein